MLRTLVITPGRVAAVVCVLMLVACASSAVAAPPLQPVPPYGEALRIPATPGPDTKAKFEALTTEASSLEPGKFVYPIAMAVDTNDELAPEKYAIYVLDLVNPQALSNHGERRRTETKLQYRLQKLENIGSGSNVVASRMFTVESSEAEPSLHATALTVDGAAHRVYVLLSDGPEAPENEKATSFAADRIDAWTTGTGSRAGETALASAAGLDEDKLATDPSDGAGELVGPDAPHHLQPASPSSLEGEIEGESIVLDGSGEDARVALAGNEYGLNLAVTPTIVTFATGVKGEAGAEGPKWGGAGKASDVAATENSTATAFGSSQHSGAIYSASGNPDGSLTLSLGPAEFGASTLLADQEPNVANVSVDLSQTIPVLPWESALAGLGAATAENFDGAATDGFAQDLPSDNKQIGQMSAATATLSPLGPSLVQLAGDEPQFPSGVYAGLVANRGGGHKLDPQQGAHKVPYSWKTEWAELNSSSEVAIEVPASFGIRVFDGQGQSLGMIGDTTTGGPCNLQGGPRIGYTGGEGASFAALVAGREGVVFALVQPDLASNAENSVKITPATPLDSGIADQVVEFKPNDTAAGQECPQPSGNFSITDESAHSAPSTGSEPVTVAAGTKLKFDASQVNLQGGAAWNYEWDLENGAPGGVVDHPWTLLDEFAEPVGAGNWSWPSSVVEHEYTTPGMYTVKLNLVNDFGVLADQRTVIVEPTEQPVAKFTVAQPITAGKSVTFDASTSIVPAHDSIVNYHWEFDGQGEDQPESTTQHIFMTPGNHTITLKITDAFHKKAETSEMVNVSEESKGGGGSTGGGGSIIPGPGLGTSTGTKVSPPPVVKKPLTNAQKLAKALRVCRKIKAKKRRTTCEKQAKKKYGPKKKSAKTKAKTKK